jgi:hypothetical protein
MDPNSLEILNSIDLTFEKETLHEEITCDKFPIFWLSEYYNDNLVLFAACFYDD